MKKLFLFILLSLPISVMATTFNYNPNNSSKVEDVPETSFSDAADQANDSIDADFDRQGRFKIYFTVNFYNFLRLDSSTGVISQYQWSLSDAEGFIGFINRNDLSDGKPFPGRFSLHPTKNNWTFILLDTYDGRLWHIQWGMSESDRTIQRIYW